MSPLEENKRIAWLWLHLVSEGCVEEMCKFTHSNWKMYGGPPNLPSGEEGLRALFQSIGPVEQTWTIHDIIAEGDRVVVRATNRCRQESFLGIPGNGVWQTFTATFIHRIVDGKVVETWRNADDLGRMFQLGVRLEPGAATQPVCH